jgi:hypothetical protein
VDPLELAHRARLDDAPERKILLLAVKRFGRLLLRELDIELRTIFDERPKPRA